MKNFIRIFTIFMITGLTACAAGQDKESFSEQQEEYNNIVQEQKELTEEQAEFAREMAAEQADEYIKGRKDFPQKVPVAVELVTQENIAKYTAYGRESDQ